MSKYKVMKEVEGRNEQFERIKGLKRYHLSRGNAVLSIDAKKKEYLGAFYRSGSVLADGRVSCYDHDFNSFATGKIVPQGIYNLGLNEGYMFIGKKTDDTFWETCNIRHDKVNSKWNYRIAPSN